MRNIKKLKSMLTIFSLTAVITATTCQGLWANDTQADNSKINELDRKHSEPTADQAKNNVSDRQTMQKIRKSIISDKSLSTYGHNVKVIAQNGQVTLKGTVHTQEEKNNIEAKASEIAGKENVINKIKIKGS